MFAMQCFKRRGKEVKGGKEAQYWQDITADMMSDEEKQGEVCLPSSFLPVQYIDKVY